MASVAYAVCPSCPANIITGSGTLSIVNATGLATFTVAQTNVLFGVGMEISYNDGTARKAYIASKVSTTQWYVTTALGANPPDCSGATITAVTAPYASMSAAEAGCNDANHTNNTDITATGANLTALNISCYCEQSGYTADTTTVTWNAMTGDATHRPYIYSPTNTTTECNLAMFPTSPKYSVQKYRLIANSTIVKSTTANWLHLNHLQLYSQYLATSAINNIGTTLIAGETNDILNCIIVTSEATAAGSRIGIRQLGNVAGATLNIVNNTIVLVPSGRSTASYGVYCSTGTSTINAYSNTIYGWLTAPLNRVTSANVINSLNNTFIGNGTTTAGCVKNYDVYDINESEANGFLTTQTDAQLFADVSDASPLNWDWTPKAGSDLIDKGSTLGAPYNVDILGTSRPQRSVYCCGAVEYITPGTISLSGCTPATGYETGNTVISISGLNLTTPTGVTINAVACTSVVLVSSTLITCITPANPVGTYDIVVTIGGTDYILEDAFTYTLVKSLTLTYGATSVSFTPPLFGYKTIIDMPFDFSEQDDGTIDSFDNGTAYDKRVCRFTLELNAADAEILREFLYETSRGHDITMTLSSGSGFHPFGPDKGDAGSFTVSFSILDHRGVGESPYLYFHMDCEIVNVGSYPSYTPPDEVDEGVMQIGSITGLRFPPSWFKPKQEYALNVQHTESNASHWVDRGLYGDSYKNQFTLQINESKLAALLTYIIGTARNGNLGLTAPENAYPFGIDNGGDGSAMTTKLTSGTFEITHNRYNDFTMNMELALVL
jgi:hypothetical protein